jgi:dolichol kinase
VGRGDGTGKKKQRGKRKETGRKLFHVTDRIAFASFYRMNSINIATFIGSFFLSLSLSLVFFSLGISAPRVY